MKRIIIILLINLLNNNEKNNNSINQFIKINSRNILVFCKLFSRKVYSSSLLLSSTTFAIFCRQYFVQYL